MKKISLILLLATSTLFSKETSFFNTAQLAQWREMEECVTEVRDGRGMPIDDQIKDLVIVLNLLGIKTSQSCEGHLNWGLPFPWVEFCPWEDITKLDAQKEKVLEKIAEIESEIARLENEQPGSDLEELFNKWEIQCQENSMIFQQIHELQCKSEKKMWDLLDEFYGSRDNYNIHSLVVRDWRVFPLGGEWKGRYTGKDIEKNLSSYRKEMDAFKEFLIKKYASLNQ
ncbi:hypothetical protein [Simkania sp.]|uniref:hypothetical protein n=1 Tax=Simkania sp. TaxID=34094 RepID=UPI003B518156